MPATYTPIRYPGGKTKLYAVIDAIISENDFSSCSYVEPFAGGAGLAVKLLLKDKVTRIVLNDFDRAIYCMWDAIVHHPDRLCSAVRNAKLTIQEWSEYREVYRNRNDYSDLDLGIASFYLNRTNISGILKGGVIGGLAQNGAYKMDARFNKDNLIRKISSIAERAEDISIHNLDVLDFIDGQLPLIASPFVYFDPPYVKKGPGLYKNSFKDLDHEQLSRKVSVCKCPWVMTYDSNDFISSLYEPFIHSRINVPYSAKTHRIGSEELILSPNVKYTSVC